MKNTIKSAIAVTLLVSFASAVQAVPITGTIRMAGNVTLNDTSLATADSATFSNPAAIVVSGDNSFAGTTGNAVSWSNFSWNPSSAPVDDLWSFTTVGLWTYTFDLASINSVSQSAGLLYITGTGTVDIVGLLDPYDATPATWSFTITDTSGGTSGSFEFGFSDSNTAVPDGGTTVMLLGGALAGLGLLRKKLVA